MVIWDKFKELWKYYVFQSLLTGLVIFIVVLTVGKDKVVIIASMGATAFICFVRTKHVIGGHFIALICGAIFVQTAMPYYVEFPSAVALAVFLMVVFNVEHPPAAGTALAAVVKVDDDVYGGVETSKLPRILKKYHQEEDDEN